MKIHPRLLVSITFILCGAFALAVPGLPPPINNQQRPHGSQRSTQQQSRVPNTSHARRASRKRAPATIEDAYRANNLGVALLEQFKYREGAEAFRRALEINPQLSLARINLSIALYNMTDIAGARREAQRAAAVLPAAPQPQYILGLIARAQNRPGDALAAFQRVLELDSDDVGASVNLGQLYVQQRRYGEAINAFRAALAAEPYNTTALYNLATALRRTGETDAGRRVLQRFQALRQSGAGTAIGQNYLEQGRYAEAVISTGAESELIDRATPDVRFVEATAAALPDGSRKRADERRPSVTTAPPSVARNGDTIFGFVLDNADLSEEVKRELAAAFGGGATLFDFDGDADLDLFELAPPGQRLYRNDGGKFVDVTERSGTLRAEEAGGVGIGAVAGDYDNDGKTDLFVLRYAGRSALYRNEGDGRFSDQTVSANIPAFTHLSVSSAFVDVDHDGDLDLFIPGFTTFAGEAPGGAAAHDAVAPKTLAFPRDFAGAPNLLLRNNGDGTFRDITSLAGVEGARGHAVAIVPTDYDNRRDIDLLVVNYDRAPTLWRNMRDGSFRDVAQETGLDTKGAFTSATAGDVNKDGFIDFFFGRADAPGLFALSDARGRFRLEAAPDALGSQTGRQLTAHMAAQFLDYDNDGLLDLVAVSSSLAGRSLHVWRNVGDGWENASERAAARGLFESDQPRSELLSPPRLLVAGDTDGDGDTDLFVRSKAGGLRYLRNEGTHRNHSVGVRLSGRASNQGGVGAKIEARAGSLWQKLETYAATPAPAPADITFGLGRRPRPDSVRVQWPAGIVQTETEFASAAETARSSSSGHAKKRSPASSPQKLSIIELDRKPSSCPYLYTWNGERFEFVTDFMGGGELGYWVAPGVRAAPDPEEHVRIRADQLKARDGRYELRVTNELEEALFIDRLQLIAVAHPEGVEVYPNEGLGNPSSARFTLYATRDASKVAAATDERGRDVRAALDKLDRRYVDDFPLSRLRGYAEKHTLTLDLGAPTGGRTRLLLTGWTDYAFSSDNVAAAQRGLALAPPALEVKDEKGQWQTVIQNIGVPVGRPQTVVVDLTDLFLSRRSREVRIVTNMRIYWDQILVDTSGGEFPVRLTRLEASVAELRWRGFSAETSPDGREPFTYDYTRVSFESPWKTPPGRYTREGDVRALLRRTDDMFVVSRPGDEITLEFAATALAPLPRGWTRTFLLSADGFSKEMDINSASPDGVAPLPFHGMKSYPYTAPEAYPLTPAHRAYIERYNTRVVAAPLPSLIGGQ